MNTPKHPDLGVALEHSRSGLRDNHRRSLARLLFFVTGSALVVFAVLQFFNGFPWVSAIELLASRSEEHTSELQSRPHVVCRLLLEKKNYVGFMVWSNFTA